jgi:hypothetical protein
MRCAVHPVPAREWKVLRYLVALAIGAAFSLGSASSSGAGSCTVGITAIPTPCVESYLVNQGPVFSGPGHYRHQLADPEPCCYPYVGPVFTGYPYGLNDSGGYPRGFYSPFVGYPYAEPAPYVAWSPYPARRRHFHHWRHRY